jgi:hypothetical protein
MKTIQFLRIGAAVFVAALSFTACSTSGVQDARMSGVERRQDRIDSRYNARQERWAERGAREDARAQARFDSW